MTWMHFEKLDLLLVYAPSARFYKNQKPLSLPASRDLSDIDGLLAR